MPAPLSNDLRLRILSAVKEESLSCHAAARRYNVAASTVIKLKRHADRHGSHKPLKVGGSYKHKLSRHHATVMHLLSNRPDMTLAELGESLEAQNIFVSRMGIYRYLCHIGMTFKKRRCMQRSKTEMTLKKDANSGESIKTE
jgi:putative transposase